MQFSSGSWEAEALMKSAPGLPITLGTIAAAGVRLIVWYLESQPWGRA